MASAGDHLRALPGSGINQTSFMFGAAIFAFAFFVTVRGDLGQWLGLLGLASSAASPAGTSQPSSQSPSAGAGSLPSIPGIGTGTGAGGLTSNDLLGGASSLLGGITGGGDAAGDAGSLIGEAGPLIGLAALA